MYLLLDQLVYTSFAGKGFSTLASAQVSVEIQQAFMQRVAQYWDSYNPPASGYRAVYLYQLSPEQTLFGWLYNDGFDDVGRSDVPLFVCYYLTEPLFDFQLDNIFTCLEKGPVALIDRHNPLAWLETKVIPNLWSYQPVRQGVAIGLAVRQRSYSALQQGELLDMFVSVDEQETVVDLNGQTYEQQMATLSIYTSYVINGLNLPTVDVHLENAITNQTTAIQSYHYKQKLQPYKQVLAKKNQLLYPPTANTHSLVVRDKIKQPIKWNRQKVADNTAKNIYTITAKQPTYNISSKPKSSQTINKTANYDSVLAHQKTQLLKIGIAASALALAVGIYGLHQASVSNSNYRNPISWAKGSVDYKTLADVPNVPQGSFKYGGSTSFAPLRSQNIIKAIAKAHPQFKLFYTDPIPHKHGSGIGIEMLLAGKLSFAQSSRPLKESEILQAQKLGFTLKQIPIAIDGIAFYVNSQIPVSGLSLNQIRDIFTGKITNWKQLGGSNLPITPFTRNPQFSGTADFFKQKVLAKEELAPNVQQVETTTDSIRLVAKTPGGIGYATASEVIGQKSVDPMFLATINPLPLSIVDNQDFVPPFNINNKNIVNMTAFANGSYPLTRPLFIIIKQNGKIDEQAGIAYTNLLSSKQGQQMIEQAGFVTMP